MHIIGHRGAPAHFPENTLLSFQKTIDLQLSAVEFDVMLTKDQIPVVFHDASLKRLCAGDSRLIKDVEYKYLPKINHYFNIPTLEDVLRIYQHHPFIKLHIEIKDTNAFHFSLPIIEKFQNNYFISSFDLDFIRAVKKKHHLLHTIALIEHQCDDLSLLSETYLSDAVGVNFSAYDQQTPIPIVSRVPVFAFTVNSRAGVKRAEEMGIAGVYTDFPDIFK